MESELRPLVPSDYEVNVYCPKDPATYAWEGAAAFALSPEYHHLAVTKAQYEEQGVAVRRY